MTDERDPMWRRWAEVDRVFDAALEQPPAARRAYVVEACGSDTDLRDAVLGLLEAHDSADGFLGPSTGMLRAAFGPQGGERRDRVALEPGAVVGRFRVTRELGRGGMATVYEAERTDGGFEQRVAVKILDRLSSKGDVVGRFLAERQILSGLVHPNIARLLDGGSTPDGHPYFVMEKVDGDPITKWADERRLGVSERLDLFRQVAEAVGYAHTRLIVHRDLKPANVLVGEDGQARLLDFGIAKLLDRGSAGGDEAGDAPTRWMTPQYASPEQIMGLPVTTASDVHGLGMILYELLTGHRPFGGDVATDYEVQRAICEEAPERPSSVVGRGVEPRDRSRPEITPASVSSARGTTQPDLGRELEGDLDAIVMKALRREPESRYGTVHALLEDVERYRTGFPVQARSGAWAYAAGKFVRRNRWGVGAAAALVTVLAGSSVLLSIEQAETARERDRATREATNARLVIDFLADVFRGRDPNQAPSDTITARELLAWGKERVDTEFADRPDVQAELLSVMGGAHYNLGLLDEAVELHERSVALRREIYGDTSAEAADALDELANAHGQNRDFEFAKPIRDEVLAIRRALTGPASVETGRALRAAGLNNRDLGLLDVAETQLREALAIHRSAPDSDSTDIVEDLLALAYVLRARDELDEAEALYEEAIPLYRSLHGPRDSDLPTYLNNLAYLHRVRGDYEGALPLYREALDLNADLFGRGHPGSLMLGGNLASALELLGRHDDVISILRENLDAALEQWPEGHWRVGSAYAAVGRGFLRHGRPAEAEAPLDAAIREYTETLGAGHDWTAFAMAARAVCHIMLGREAEGRDLLDRFHAGLKERIDANDGQVLSGTVDQIEILLYVLDDTGMAEDAARFRTLLPGTRAE